MVWLRLNATSPVPGASIAGTIFNDLDNDGSNYRDDPGEILFVNPPPMGTVYRDFESEAESALDLGIRHSF